MIFFCLKENATYGVKNELVDNGMRNEVWSINDQDFKRAIKLNERGQGNRLKSYDS